MLVAAATDDRVFSAEQRERVRAAIASAGVRHTIEIYFAAYGFAATDNPTYDSGSDRRHWAASTDLHAAELHA